MFSKPISEEVKRERTYLQILPGFRESILASLTRFANADNKKVITKLSEHGYRVNTLTEKSETATKLLQELDTYNLRIPFVLAVDRAMGNNITDKEEVRVLLDGLTRSALHLDDENKQGPVRDFFRKRPELIFCRILEITEMK